MMDKKVIIILLSITMVFTLFACHNSNENYKVIPYVTQNKGARYDVLIASQGSSFKDSLVSHVLKDYQDQSIRFKVIDAYTLFTVDIEKWDAIIIINSWEYVDPPKNIREFIRSNKKNADKLIILSTVGSHNMVFDDIDTISGESVIEKIPDYTKMLSGRLDKILNKT